MLCVTKLAASYLVVTSHASCSGGVVVVSIADILLNSCGINFVAAATSYMQPAIIFMKSDIDLLFCIDVCYLNRRD